jgi:hypothetical protein
MQSLPGRGGLFIVLVLSLQAAPPVDFVIEKAATTWNATLGTFPREYHFAM